MMTWPVHGFVDVFTPDGAFVRRLISQGRLDSPWGLALAPSDFGRFSGALLVGNFGNGRIHAYDPATGHLLGTLREPAPDRDRRPVGLRFGNGVPATPTRCCSAPGRRTSRTACSG